MSQPARILRMPGRTTAAPLSRHKPLTERQCWMFLTVIGVVWGAVAGWIAHGAWG